MTSLPVRSVVTDEDIKRGYAADSAPAGAWPSSPAPSDFTLVRARDVADVVAVLEHAQAHRLPVVPQGARTSRVGGARAVEGGIVLNLEALDAVEDIDPLEGLAVVGPGVVTDRLKAAVSEAGLMYGPDPASAGSCTIGGNVATNAGGLCCVKYGVTADWVRALEVVLPGGEVMRTGHRTAKGVAGFDLTGLVVGSEGTLGVVTRVVTRLEPLGDPALTALATFASLDDAVRAVTALRLDRHRPSLLEILDRASIEAVQAVGDFGFPADCEAVLLVQSDRAGHTHDDVERYGTAMVGAGAVDVAVADDVREADALLQGRRVLSTAIEGLGARLAEDVCVPVARLGDFVRGAAEVAARHRVRIPVSGHAGDGNLHPSVVHTLGDPDETRRAWAAFDDLMRLGLDLGGTVAGEHGIGRLKTGWLREEAGRRELDRQRALKAVFDPQGIMNPGVVFGGASDDVSGTGASTRVRGW